MMETSLTFRLAKPEDFDNVVKLSEGIYGGFDYLPLRYHQWLKQSNRIVMLACLGNKIVGLQSIVVIDNGKTALERATRIHADYRGSGYATQLSKANRDYIQQRYTNICRQRLTAIYRRSSEKYRELYVYHSLSGIIDNNTSLAENLPNIPCNLKSCTKEYLSYIVLSHTTAQELFPNEIVMIEWCPYEAIRSNIDYILKEGDQVFVEPAPEGCSPRSFSHGRNAPTTKFKQWICTIYASDPMLFEAHLLKQMECAYRAGHEKVIFVSFQEECFVDLGRRLITEVASLPECLNYKETVTKMILHEMDW